MSASSWNWRIVEFESSYREWVAKMFGAHDHSYSVVCKKKGCGKMAECFVVYDYVTGRQGRISSNDKPYCRPHSEQIILKKTEPPKNKEYIAHCLEHEIPLIDGRCEKCRDADGNTFVLDMQSYYLVPLKRRCGALKAR
jgi:hypothetical protein